MKLVAALAAVAAVFVAVPGGAVGGTAACAADENRFAIMVDFGDAPGAPSGNTVTCVPVDGDDTAADALVTRARMLGRPVPRYNNAGLLCSLDGFPESGCGERTEAGYRYWSYWFGGEAWSYASTGPAFHRAKPGGAVGWRFQPTGAANATDPPPRASARFTDLCPAAATSAAPPTTAPPPVATTEPAQPLVSTSEASTTTQPPEAALTTTTTTTVALAASSTSSSTAPGVIDDGGDDNGGSSWPVAAGGLALGAAIGGAAALKARRR